MSPRSFFRAQALPGPRGTRKSPRIPASSPVRRGTRKSPRVSSSVRRGLWVWPDPDPTAVKGPATYRNNTRSGQCG